MSNHRELTQSDIERINARNRPRMVKRGDWQAPVEEPGQSGRPKEGEGFRELEKAKKREAALARSVKRKAKLAANPKPPKLGSPGEEALAFQLEQAGIRDYVREHRFHEKRMWRLDFAWPKVKLAVEVEGGTFSNGRHNRGKGFEADCEKYNELTLAGWRLLRFTTYRVKQGQAIQPITDMLCGLSMAAQNTEIPALAGRGAILCRSVGVGANNVYLPPDWGKVV